MSNERFIELLLKDLAGEISIAEKTELTSLISSNPYYARQAELHRAYWDKGNAKKANNRAAFEKVKAKIRSRGGSDIEEFNSFDQESKDGDIREEKKTLKYLLRMAAALFIVAGSYALYYTYVPKVTRGRGSGSWIVKETQRGVKSIFILNDGTRIVLNSGSSIEFPKKFSGDNREVYLSGEAFFDVKKDVEHPFIIHTDKMKIKVLGTAFNVRAYADEKVSETTLIRGEIAVTVNKKPLDQIIMKPSQKLVINDEQVLETREKKATLKPSLTTLTYFKNNDTTIVETSWINNKLIFKNEEFYSVAQKMGRWYNVDFKFDRPAVQHLKFTGVFENETVEEALRALRLTESFNYKMEDGTIRIY